MHFFFGFVRINIYIYTHIHLYMYLKVRQAAPAAGPELNQASTGPVLELPHCQMLRFADVSHGHCHRSRGLGWTRKKLAFLLSLVARGN